MTSRFQTFLGRGLVAAAIVSFALFGHGCSSDSTQLDASFVSSVTPTTARLVKLQPLSSSGTSVAVQVVIYGPDTTLDMYSFDFGVRIGNTSLVQFVPGSAVAGGALTATGAQTVVATATPNASDSSVVDISVHKTGGGAGDDIPGPLAVVVNLSFRVEMAGSTTLNITANPTATVEDSTGATIGTITFDTANGTLKGVSSGGGGGY